MDTNERNGLQAIIDEAIRGMSEDAGHELAPDEVNLAELGRRTGISRSRLRRLKGDGFVVLPHGRCGARAAATVLTGHTDLLDDLLRRGVTNSSVCLGRLRADGYEGSLSTVKNYIRGHRSLVPARRRQVEPQGGRGQRWRTAPGEAYQMDWGFVDVEGRDGATSRIACFAMVCHHCGACYVEFFTSARQENLFIGMLHAFAGLGVPEWVLTDNMRSVVTRRDADGRPVWQRDYAAFMECVGFKTRLCKPRHPYTKGKVERLIRFVKGNFLAGREFTDITALNAEALSWCEAQGRRRRADGTVPGEEHARRCRPAARELAVDGEVELYLCPRRRVSFDGFVTYEGRRFGVPYWYAGRDCRVSREGDVLHVYSDDLALELSAHRVTWSRLDSPCEGQWADAEPVELPTAPVRDRIPMADPPSGSPELARFDFGRGM